MNPITRRQLFSRLARGAGVAIAAPSLVELLFKHALAHGSNPAHKRLILLWLEGGPSQIDTFDPKPGAATNGPFRSLDTDVAGWRFCEHLPGLASRAGKLSVIRTMTSKEGTHARARDLLHCGYSPNPSVQFPSIGSIVAHEIGELEAELPAFVQVTGPQSRPSYLGVNADPFWVDNPRRRIENLPTERDLAMEKGQRDAVRAALDAEFAARGGAHVVAANDAQRVRAERLMHSKLLTAFDLEGERVELRRTYGNSDFGQGVLLARRLLEHGVTAVEVVLDGWDTHTDNFRRTQALCEQLDPAFSALLDDLESRGMLEQTLVVCMGEFGRTPSVWHGAGRNHWPGNYCVALAGGGIKGGTVLGETDERGENIVKRPVTVPDLFSTFAQ